jgi:methylmalonyl-CoA mutase N-terminal domain/subunit
LSLPTEASARIALRTQQIVAHESGVCDFIDPLGGSWAVEQLTDELESRAEQYLSRIDEMGGMVEAISRGYPQHEIEDAAYTAQKEVEEKKQVVVGVNEFASESEPPFEMLRLDPELEAQQVARLKVFRQKRSADDAARTTADLQRAAEGKENLMPFIVSAVKAKVTLGEIANALRKVFGEHTH